MDIRTANTGLLGTLDYAGIENIIIFITVKYVSSGQFTGAEL